MRNPWAVAAGVAALLLMTTERQSLAIAPWLVPQPQGARPTAGILEGTVRLNPPVAPAATRVENTTDPAVCGRLHTLEDLVVSRTGGIASAIVALEDVPDDRIPPVAPGRLVFDNRQCRFVPHVAVLTTGSVIDLLNSDPTLHTVHLYGPAEANIALPLQGMRIPRTLDRPGLIVVKCDVHGWMQAFLRVDRHPFHAVTTVSGAFRLPRIPPGEYTLSVWHERLGEQRRRVDVRAGRTVRADVEYALR